MRPETPCGHLTTVKTTSDVGSDNLHRCVGCGKAGRFIPDDQLRLEWFSVGGSMVKVNVWDEAGAIAGLRAALREPR